MEVNNIADDNIIYNRYLKIRQEDLIELNNSVDKIIEEKNRLNKIDWDLIKQIALSYCNNFKFKDEKDSKEIILKKYEIVLLALDFFKSIDKDFHMRVLKIVFGKYDKAVFTYFKRSEINDFEEKDDIPGFEGFKKYLDAPCNFELDNRLKVNMPILCGWTYNEELSKKLKRDEGTIEDLYALVHELAHTLEAFLDEDWVNIDGRISNPQSDIFSESTAIGFERALTTYLLNKGVINSRQDTKGYCIEREIDTLNKSISTYSKIALAQIKEQKGSITEEEFNRAINEIKLGIPVKGLILWWIIKDGKENMKMLQSAGYAFSGALAPRIEELIINGEIDKIKDYIEALKHKGFKDTIEALGITLDANGVKLVEEGILRSVSELELSKGEER